MSRHIELTVILKGCKQRDAERIAVEIVECYWPKATVIVAHGNHKYAIVQADGANDRTTFELGHREIKSSGASGGHREEGSARNPVPTPAPESGGGAA